MFAPDSHGLLVALGIVALLALVLVVRCRAAGLRLVGGLVAVAAGFAAGIVAVNVYFGYFTSWSDVASGLDSGPAAAAVIAPSTGDPVTPAVVAARVAALKPSASGYLLSLVLPGRLSHLNRTGLVWLPPQYREPAYAHTRFPVVELIPGTPGQPADWTTNLHVTATLAALTKAHRIAPMVVVMAPSNPPRGAGHGQECTDAPGGPEDGVYVGVDIPADIATAFRVAAPGSGWAVAGYSSGGYCAANLALQHPGTYSAVADLDGYLSPVEDGPLWHVIFHRDTVAIDANDVLAELRAYPALRLPPFYLVAGTGNREDLDDLDRLRAALRGRTTVTAHVTPRAGHTFPVWRRELPALFEWLSRELEASRPATAPRAA